MSDAARDDRVKLFTLTEATSLLQIVETLLVELADAKREFESVQAKLALLSPEARQNGHKTEAIQLELRLEKMVDRLSRGIGEFERLGIELKDIDQGIVDFPSLHHGRVIYLCWRLGETSIGFWHEISSGFAGRRPISELSP